MFIIDSFVYTDISAEIYRNKGNFTVQFKTGDLSNISLTFNHIQAKALAERLLEKVNQTEVKELLANTFMDDLGDMKIKFRAPKGEEEECQQNILSALTEPISLSKPA